MAKQLIQAEASQKQRPLPYGSLLLKEYEDLDGADANLIHMRREFCSELFELAPHLQELVIAAQPNKSLHRLIQTISRFKNFDTGELTHEKEIALIEQELEKRSQNKNKKITMSQLEKALESLRNRRH